MGPLGRVSRACMRRMTSLRHLHDVYISVLGSQNSFAAPAGADWFRRVVAHGHVFMNGDCLLNNTRTYFCPRILLHIISFQCTLLVNLKSVLPKPISATRPRSQKSSQIAHGLTLPNGTARVRMSAGWKEGGDTLLEGLFRRAQEPCGGTSWAMEVVWQQTAGGMRRITV